MGRADIEVPNLPVDVSSWGRSACYPQRTFYPMSDGPSIQNHRITILYFRTCSACKPPILFWRRPPQSNYPPCNVPAGWRVRLQTNKGRYFKVDSTMPSDTASKS